MTSILCTATTIQFNPETPLWLDVQDFEAQAARPDLASLQAAADLYRGDFLSGFYDDWVISERYRLESVFLDALARLMAAQEAQGESRGSAGRVQAAARQGPFARGCPQDGDAGPMPSGPTPCSSEPVSHL